MKRLLILAGLLSACATTAFAQTGTAPVDTPNAAQWRQTHPRRAEVNARLANQNHRINQEVKEGDMSATQAAKLHRKDRAIRREERRMAARHGGHITKAEQQALNRQENRVSHQIGK